MALGLICLWWRKLEPQGIVSQCLWTVEPEFKQDTLIRGLTGMRILQQNLTGPYKAKFLGKSEAWFNMRNYSRETFKTASITENVVCLSFFSFFFFYPIGQLSLYFTLAQSPLLNHCKVCLWAFCDQECMEVCEHPAIAPPSVEVEDILMVGFTVAWSLRTYQCFLHFIIFLWTEISFRKRGTKTRTIEMHVRVTESKGQATAKVLDHTGHSSKAPGLLCQYVSVFKS